VANAAPPRSASTFWKCQHPSSPTPSATTPSPQPTLESPTVDDLPSWVHTRPPDTTCRSRDSGSPPAVNPTCVPVRDSAPISATRHSPGPRLGLCDSCGTSSTNGTRSGALGLSARLEGRDGEKEQRPPRSSGPPPRSFAPQVGGGNQDDPPYGHWRALCRCAETGGLVTDSYVNPALSPVTPRDASASCPARSGSSSARPRDADPDACPRQDSNLPGARVAVPFATTGGTGHPASYRYWD
jgi:hypothetical protein